MIKCDNCKTSHSVRDVINGCTVSWPTESWVSYLCPQCGHVSHLRVEEGRIQTGEIGAAKKSTFVVQQTVEVGGLEVDANPEGITLTLGGVARTVPAK